MAGQTGLTAWLRNDNIVSGDKMSEAVKQKSYETYKKCGERALFVALALALHAVVLYPFLNRQKSPDIQMGKPASSTMMVELTQTQEPVSGEAEPVNDTPPVETPPSAPPIDENAGKSPAKVKQDTKPKVVPTRVTRRPVREPEKLPAQPQSSPSEASAEKRASASEKSSPSTNRTDNGHPGGAAAPAPAPAYTAASSAGYSNNPAPEYPSLALRRRWEGTVVLQVQVLRDGRTGEIRVQSSSGRTVLDQSAIEAVRHWRFNPARRAGVAEESRVSVPLQFKLR